MRRAIIIGIFIVGAMLIWTLVYLELNAGASKPYYDNNNNLVRGAGSNPASLADFQRRVLIQGFDSSNGQELFSNLALGWAVKEQNKNYVVVPLDAFYLMNPYLGPVPAWRITEITLKAYLLQDAVKEDDRKKEELGDININEDMHLAVIERKDPIVDVRTDYVVGKYEKLAVGDLVYVVSQANGRMNIMPSPVSEIYVDKSGRNLFNAPGGESGGLAFAVRRGKFQLVGFRNAMEPVQNEYGTFYLYYTDIQQVIDFIKTPTE